MRTTGNVVWWGSRCGSITTNFDGNWHARGMAHIKHLIPFPCVRQHCMVGLSLRLHHRQRGRQLAGAAPPARPAHQLPLRHHVPQHRHHLAAGLPAAGGACVLAVWCMCITNIPVPQHRHHLAAGVPAAAGACVLAMWCMCINKVPQHSKLSHRWPSGRRFVRVTGGLAVLHTCSNRPCRAFWCVSLPA